MRSSLNLVRRMLGVDVAAGKCSAGNDGAGLACVAGIGAALVRALGFAGDWPAGGSRGSQRGVYASLTMPFGQSKT
jgi:hypothetical protein